MLDWITSERDAKDGLLSPDAEMVIEVVRQQASRNVPDWDREDWGATVDLVKDMALVLWNAVSTEPGGYDWASSARVEAVEAHCRQLRQGLPPERTFADADGFVAEVIHAGWVTRYSDPKLSFVPRLVVKAIESDQFVRLWTRTQSSDGRTGELENLSEPAHAPVVAPSGVLARTELCRRLTANEGSRLVVRPLLEKGLGRSSIDVRLGNRFLTFQRNATRTFVTSNMDNPRGVQRAVEKAWGEPFVLHPGELVLASTFEYIALPHDLTAQLITRSSYGRLGLITATAVQVHPQYHGCLTLELVNLGLVPLELVPGERLAQLVFTLVQPGVDDPIVGGERGGSPASADRPQIKEYLRGKYACPTSPEFSQIARDEDLSRLRVLRLVHEERLRPQG